ncbi:hypothetical protein MFIFM68171_00061 [Madurella fahalii]|uniref:Uncharacterized protein n=1 Tax=Madurella fahalii TaxID=1157608 RepID=A0ABQ0FWH1_9PEZI
MEHFSQVSAAATCSDLARAAQSTATKVQVMVPASSIGDQVIQKRLSFLIAGLQKFGEQADHLGHCVADASVVHPQLRDILKQALLDCENAMSILSDSLLSEHGELGVDTASRYQAFLAASSRFFVFSTQLLTIESEQQQHSKLASPDAQDILDTAHNATKGVFSLRYVTQN